MAANKSVEINAFSAPGLTIARDPSAPEMRLFDVHQGSTLQLNYLTLTGGVARGNNGPGLGGAIYVTGAYGLFLGYTTLYNNKAIGNASGNAGYGEGGAIYSTGATLLVIARSTLSGNTAQGSQAGGAYGGAIFSQDAVSVIISQTTLAYNTVASSAGVQSGGALFDFASTSKLELDSSILADSIGSVDVVSESDHSVVGGANLIPSSAGVPGNLIAETRDPKLGALQYNGGWNFTHALLHDSPAIGKAGSTSVDTTDQRGIPIKVGTTFDIGAYQFVTHFTVNSAVDQRIFGVFNNSTGQVAVRFTLRYVIGLANTTDAPVRIDFDPSLAGQTISLSLVGDAGLGNSAFLVSNALTIDSSTAPRLTIARNPNAPAMRLFRIVGPADYAGAPRGSLTLRDLTLSGGLAHGGDGQADVAYAQVGGGGGGAGLGGAILNRGTLTIENSTLTANEAVGGNGGAVGGPSGGFGGGPNGGSPAVNGGFGGGGGGGVGTIPAGNGGFGGGGGGAGQGLGGSAGFSGFGGGSGTGPESYTAYIVGAGGGGAGLGGAIFNDGGIVSISDSTLAGNAALGGLGARLLSSGYVFGFGGSGFGGAIFNRDGTVTLANSTLAGNAVLRGFTDAVPARSGSSAGGAVYNLHAAGPAILNLTNSILAGSLGAADGFNNGGTVTGDHNLIQDNSGNTGIPSSVILVSGDPKLGPLQNNGGPTRTMALLPGSPAIGVGDFANPPAWDQRGPGFPRVVGFTMDLGAFEVQTAAPTVTTTTLMSSANPSAYGQLVTFTAVVKNGTLLPSGTVLFKEGDTVLAGPVALVFDSQLGMKATFSTSLLGTGVHVITAYYSGNATFIASAGTLSQTVQSPMSPGAGNNQGHGAGGHAEVVADDAGGATIPFASDPGREVSAVPSSFRASHAADIGGSIDTPAAIPTRNPIIANNPATSAPNLSDPSLLQGYPLAGDTAVKTDLAGNAQNSAPVSDQHSLARMVDLAFDIGDVEV